MLKLVVFAVFFVSSPTFGLLETLFQSENNCYSGCHSNYATSLSDVDACKTGCDYKLHNEKCADQCKILSIDEQIQASCVVGCSMNQLKINEHPHSIILVRLRQHSSIKTNPTELFNNMIKQLNDKKNNIQKSTDLSLSDNIKTVIRLTKNVPLNKLSDQIHTDSLNEDETHTIRHFLIIQQDKSESSIKSWQQFFINLHNKWNDLVRQQPKLPMWILFSIFLSLSAILWYMIVSLCCRTPGHHTLSIHPQELVFDSIYEKEKILPNEEYYQVNESMPIKVKLTNI